MECAINTESSKFIEIFETNHLKLKSIVHDPQRPTRKLSQLICTLIKPLLKHIKNVPRDSLNLLFKRRRYADEDTKIVRFDVINLYKFGTQIWIAFYNRPTDSKRYVPCTSNYLRH